MARKEVEYNSQEYAEILPPEGHSMVAPRVFELLQSVLSDKEDLGLHEKWLDHYRYTVNKPFKQPLPGLPKATANLLHRHLTRTVNTLTDNHPTFEVAATGGLDDEIADKLESTNHWIHYFWSENEQQDAYARSVRRGEIYGVAVEKVIFNPDAEGGMGEAETVCVDPYHFGVYPPGCQDVQKAEAVFHFYPMQVRQAKRMWPDKAAQIKADDKILEELSERRREIMVQDHGKREVGMFRRLIGQISNLMGRSDHERSDETLICEAWVKDYSMVEVESDDGTNLEPKYPGYIRRVTVCSFDVLLEDAPNPNVNREGLSSEEYETTYLWDKFPFVVVNSQEDDGSIWGMSDFEQLLELQKRYTIALNQYLYFTDNCVRPKIKNPKTSGVSNTAFTNDNAVINPTNAFEAQAISYLSQAEPPVDILELLSVIEDKFFKVAGTFEIEQANTGGREVVAAKAIAELLEQAATMMRGKMRNYQRLVRERGRMLLSHFQNFGTEPRWITYTEKDGTKHGKEVIGSELILPMRITIVSGSTLPQSKIAKRQEALDMFQAGVIDQQAVLEITDFPNRAEILQRMQAGQVGAVLERLAAMLPEDALSQVESVLQLEDKDFEKALQDGEVPVLPIEGQDVQRDPMADAELQDKMAGAKKAEAEAKRILAEVDRILAETEKVRNETAKIAAETSRIMREAERMDSEEEFREADEDRKDLATLQQEERHQKEMASEPEGVEA